MRESGEERSQATRAMATHDIDAVLYDARLNAEPECVCTNLQFYFLVEMQTSPSKYSKF